MNRLITITLALAALALAATPLLAAPMSAAGAMDIGELMSRAEEKLDLDTTDAVLLFDGRDVSIASDGSVTTIFHQIVWISTELGIDEYADLRIPWNTTNATLDVSVLRTWMDGRWWPHETNLNPTAIVETTPYGVANADDYTTMRETMLLHDGVELPCIMETAYTITRRYPEGVGSDGLWILQRDDPAMFVRYSVSVAPDVALSFAAGNGAPEPEVTQTAAGHRYVWEMRDLPRLGVPHVGDATSHAPYACWSTWSGWDALGSALTASLDRASVLTDALRDTVAAMSEYEMHVPARVEAVAAFVADATRLIGYDSSHWAFEPRTAGRVYETAYGHRLDRAALAMALLLELPGVSSVAPVFRTAVTGDVDMDVAGLSRFGGMELLVGGEDFRGIYDPASSSFTEGLPDELVPHAVWDTRENAPHSYAIGAAPDGFTCAVSMERDDEGLWTGTGRATGSGPLAFYRNIVGVGSETERFCDGIADDIVGDAEILGCNVAALDPERTSVGFTFEWTPGDPDDRERTALTFGLPGSGVEGLIPSDAHLYEGRRTSPVLLPATLGESLLLRVKLSEDSVVMTPASLDVENRVGRFTQTVERDGEWLVIERQLQLTQTTIHPEWWPELRALLLAGESAQASTILFN